METSKPTSRMDSSPSIPSKFQITLDADQLEGLISYAMMGKVMFNELNSLIAGTMMGFIPLTPKQREEINQTLLLMGGAPKNPGKIPTSDEELTDMAIEMANRLSVLYKATTPKMAEMLKIYFTYFDIKVADSQMNKLDEAIRGGI